MTEQEIKQAAREIAESIITDARGTGDDPIAWVTGNSMVPALRYFNAAERVWQDDESEGMQGFVFLADLVEDRLSKANVCLETGPDGSLYAVDMARFEFTDEDDTSETVSGQWTPVEAAS